MSGARLPPNRSRGDSRRSRLRRDSVGRGEGAEADVEAQALQGRIRGWMRKAAVTGTAVTEFWRSFFSQGGVQEGEHQDAESSFGGRIVGLDTSMTKIWTS